MELSISVAFFRKRVVQRKVPQHITDQSVSLPQPLAQATFFNDAKSKEREDLVSMASNDDHDYEKIDTECYATLSKLTLSDKHQYAEISMQTHQAEDYTHLSKSPLTEQQNYTTLSSETKTSNKNIFIRESLVCNEEDNVYY